MKKSNAIEEENVVFLYVKREYKNIIKETNKKKRYAKNAKRKKQIIGPNEQQVEKEVQTFVEQTSHSSLLQINKIIIQNRDKKQNGQFDTNDCSSIIKLIKSMLNNEDNDVYSKQFIKLITLFIVNNIKTNHDVQTFLILLLQEFVTNKQVVEMATIFYP